MPASFSRTLRSLEADRPRGRLWSVLAAAILALWLAWFLFAEVGVYECASQARLEANSEVHPLAVQIGGHVIETRLAIGRRVRAGEPLVRLDAEAQQRAIAVRRARRDAYRARRKALEREIQAVQAAVDQERAARMTAIEEWRAKVAEAEARAEFAERHAETLARLRSDRVAAEEEVREAQAEAEAARAHVRALSQAAIRVEQDRQVDENDRQARLAELQRASAELDGYAAVATAGIRQLEHEVERHVVRAPVSGRVGQVIPFRVGSVVRAAERLGAVVPEKKSRAVAMFAAASVGRVRRGQPARIRLEGFPWTQYGVVLATVNHVGSEPQSGLVRVELELDRDPPAAIPVQHGLPGSAEVLVERVSPAHLVLRAAGQWLARQGWPAAGRGPQ